MDAAHRLPSPDASTRTAQHVVGGLVTGDAQVAPDQPVAEVAELFLAQLTLDAVAVVDEGRPIGLLTRGRLLLRLSQNFGRELYARKPVTRIADPHPLVLRDDTPLATAVELAFSRGAETVYDEVIVVGAGGRYLGYASIRELVEAQGLALERARRERELAETRARDLERLERVRKQFLAHATHELRSPANVVAAVAELLRHACERGSLDDIRARVPLLLRASANLRETMNNILDLSKLEAGRADVARRAVDLASLAEDVAATARLLVGEKPVEVTVDAPRPLVVESDPQKLRHIVLNLASNAAKFTDRGQIVIAARRDGGGAVVSVSDTGCGIDADDLPRLFQPFTQLEDALQGAYDGTGLGLVITRSLAALLGGRVSVDSRRGEGSVFTVHLASANRDARVPGT